MASLLDRHMDRKRYREIAIDPVRAVKFVCGCGKPGCKECGDNPRAAGCELGCKLCNMEPDVALPFLLGQREQLHKVLKDLWRAVGFFQKGEDKVAKQRDATTLAYELRALLLSCPATRYYLDNDEKGYPGLSADLLELVWIRVGNRACICPTDLETVEDWKWDIYFCFFCRRREFLKVDRESEPCECNDDWVKCWYGPDDVPRYKVYSGGECLPCKKRREEKPTKRRKRKTF